MGDRRLDGDLADEGGPEMAEKMKQAAWTLQIMVFGAIAGTEEAQRILQGNPFAAIAYLRQVVGLVDREFARNIVIDYMRTFTECKAELLGRIRAEGESGQEFVQECIFLFEHFDEVWERFFAQTGRVCINPQALGALVMNWQMEHCPGEFRG